VNAKLPCPVYLKPDQISMKIFYSNDFEPIFDATNIPNDGNKNYLIFQNVKMN
jgi:hypothetical protein